MMLVKCIGQKDFNSFSNECDIFMGQTKVQVKLPIVQLYVMVYDLYISIAVAMQDIPSNW